MANLKGGSFEKQIKDASIRMNKIGTSKSSDSRDAHSVKTLNDRGLILKDFAQYAESNNMQGKLNELMTSQNVDNFLSQRLEGLKVSTAETYIRAMGATIESLKDNNISISMTARDLDSRVHELKANDTSTHEVGRAIENTREFLNSAYNKSYSTGVIAEVQLSLGVRVSEAVRVVNELDVHLNTHSNTIEGLIGKGGRVYESKEISNDLIAKIERIEGDVSKRGYQQDLQELGVKSHDLRYTVAKELHEQGMSKSDISTYLNHSREEITDYYLRRA